MHPIRFRYIQRGGTTLYTMRCDEFKTRGHEKSLTVKSTDRGIIAIGGRDFRGAIDLSTHGVPAVGFRTIDNDLPYTDYTLGFDTAVNTCLNLINNLRDTMTSHEGEHRRGMGKLRRYSVLRGRRGGAEAIIIPEVPINLDDIIAHATEQGQGQAPNITFRRAEPAAPRTRQGAARKTGYSIRSTIIATCRGARPPADRILPRAFGYHAVELLKNDTSNRAVGIVNNKIVDIDLVEAMNMKRPVDMHMFKLAEILAL